MKLTLPPTPKAAKRKLTGDRIKVLSLLGNMWRSSWTGNTDATYQAKQAWKYSAMATARALAKDLGLPKGTYTIRSNPGGIAVLGDVYLHHDRFYVNFSGYMCENPCGGTGYYRTCNGRKDYTGGYNRDIPSTYPKLVEDIRTLLES